MELFYNLDSRKYKYCPHDECSKNSPKKNLVLVDFFYLEIAKDHDEYEKIVHTQGFFYDIPGQELQSFFASESQVDKSTKYERKGNPYNTPDHRFFYFYLMSLFIKYSQVEREHDKNKNKKSNPVICLQFHGFFKSE